MDLKLFMCLQKNKIITITLLLLKVLTSSMSLDFWDTLYIRLIWVSFRSLISAEIEDRICNVMNHHFNVLTREHKIMLQWQFCTCATLKKPKNLFCVHQRHKESPWVSFALVCLYILALRGISSFFFYIFKVSQHLISHGDI